MQQMTFEDARTDATVGGDRAAARADRASPGWSDRAEMLVLMHANSVYPKSFVIENARAFAETQGLERPPEPRAWGAVTKRLAARGCIRAVGFAPTVSSRGSPKVAWIRA